MKENIIQIKSYNFAVSIIRTYKKLVSVKKEFILSKQLLRSGTAIGANIEEAIGGQSKKDFISKMSIAYKETRETYYWIRLLQDSNMLDITEVSIIRKDCEELLRIFTKILQSAKLTNNF
ncbi:MAG TPA: four helix bundle protein [Candidatus Nitrosocosmicus sp.]|nr:four helix bundle protein [Candidatus Nitrosocosmicus sp.]